MATVFPLRPRQLARVRGERRVELERYGQLNLFAALPPKVYSLPSRLSPFVAATLLHERGDPGARAGYEQAIREGDRVDDAYLNIGVLEYEEGRWHEAWVCFRECLKTNPGHFEGHLNLGHLYVARSLLLPAEVHYEIARSIRPDEAEVLFSLGCLYADLGRVAEAREALRLYRKLVPNEPGTKADELLEDLGRLAGP
jgi:tetratricopeptide (TPR) repeat protein